MGVGASRVESSPLVTLCTERKELIKEAVDSRYELAMAHVLYFQSLLDVGNALSRFVEEELVVLDSSDEESLSEENSHLKVSYVDSDSESGSLTDFVHHEDSEWSTGDEQSGEVNEENPVEVNDNKQSKVRTKDGGKLNENRHSKVKNKDKAKLNSNKAKVNSKLQHMRRSVPEMSTIVQEQPGIMPITRQDGDLPNFFSGYPQYGYETSSNPSTACWANDFSYDEHENRSHFYVPVDATFRCSQDDQSFGASMEYPYNDSSLHQHGNPQSFASSFNIQHSYAYFSEAQSFIASAPQTPPLPGVSPWDYLDPFNMMDNLCFYYYNQDEKESESSDAKEVREREGIPDLENEVEEKVIEEVSEEINLEGEKMEGSSGVISRGAMDEDVQKSQEKEIKSEPTPVEEDIKGSSEICLLTGSEDEHEKKDGVISEVGHTIGQENDSLGSIWLNISDTCHSKDLGEIIKEIKDSFETAFDYGKEVSTLLEVGRLPYQPMGAKLKEFSLRILGWIPLMVAASRQSSYMPLNYSTSRLLMVKTGDGVTEETVFRKYGDLSSTLEKLYVWEKKLYKEVMVEEKLQCTYDKECKMLRNLDDRGAESSKIDSVHTSIKRLLSKIDLTLSAVDAISSRVKKLRDDELLLQLIELIEGFLRMWAFLAKIHQKQLQTIEGIKVCVCIAGADVQNDLGIKATQNLENTILNWATCFNNYINSQKIFVKSLNEWLLRCILREPEETSDGTAPFSPSKMGAPHIFTVCNDWYHAIERVSETGVSEAIQNFASRLHHLQEMQAAELHHRHKSESLAKDFAKHMKNLVGNSSSHQHLNMSLTNADDSGFAIESESKLCEDSVYLKKRLDEQKAEHEEAVKQVNDAASGCLQWCVAPIFEALRRFCLQNLNAYEHIRILNKDQVI